MSTSNGSLKQSIRKAETEKILSKVNETLGSFVQLTKYHIRPNITTSERMNVINTST